MISQETAAARVEMNTVKYSEPKADVMVHDGTMTEKGMG